MEAKVDGRTISTLECANATLLRGGSWWLLAVRWDRKQLLTRERTCCSSNIGDGGWCGKATNAVDTGKDGASALTGTLVVIGHNSRLVFLLLLICKASEYRLYSVAACARLVVDAE
jgi:hypothetical protein